MDLLAIVDITVPLPSNCVVCARLDKLRAVTNCRDVLSLPNVSLNRFFAYYEFKFLFRQIHALDAIQFR